MILYHFTPVENVDAIKQQGLHPAEETRGRMLPPGECVVWLSEIPTTEMSEDDCAIFEMREGEPVVTKRWLRYRSNEPLARLTVNLQPNSRFLRHYKTWLQGRYWEGCPDPSDSFGRSVIEKWWIYFGVIPPSKITECMIEEFAGQTGSVALLNNSMAGAQLLRL
jgi:hypothetical protein